jgi:tetratricopeptide (TPR) repeat protein
VNEAEAWAAKGWELAKHAPWNPDGALAFERALTLDPACIPALLGQSLIQRRQRHYEEALAADEQAVALEPQNGPAWLSLSDSLVGLMRWQEALTALDRAMALLSAGARTWALWKSREYLLSTLGRKAEAQEAEAQEAHARYRALLEAAAGNLDDEWTEPLSEPQVRLLVERIYAGEGPPDTWDRWLALVQRDAPIHYDDPDEMEAVERSVASWHVVAAIRVRHGKPLGKEHLVALVEQLMRAEGSEAEQQAWLALLAQDTGMPAGAISDFIYWPDQEMSPAEIVERALLSARLEL